MHGLHVQDNGDNSPALLGMGAMEAPLEVGIADTYADVIAVEDVAVLVFAEFLGVCRGEVEDAVAAVGIVRGNFVSTFVGAFTFGFFVVKVGIVIISMVGGVQSCYGGGALEVGWYVGYGWDRCLFHGEVDVSGRGVGHVIIIAVAIAGGAIVGVEMAVADK